MVCIGGHAPHTNFGGVYSEGFSLSIVAEKEILCVRVKILLNLFKRLQNQKI